MSLHGWVGPGKLRELGLDRAAPPEVVEPVSVVEAEETKIYICAVGDCGRKFKHPMMIARHFNSSHDELKEDKDSWREYVEETVN